ncbi:MAG: hypothetical protein KatS3mg104_0836 [Phycisphaerae bacterium]|nr:MAG: hypothetical protein KatS3mg104_0836 [Phycisphaerae bacterium]
MTRLIHDGFYRPFGVLAKKTTWVVKKYVQSFLLGVSASSELQTSVGQHMGPGFTPVAGGINHQHVCSERFHDVYSPLGG